MSADWLARATPSDHEWSRESALIVLPQTKDRTHLHRDLHASCELGIVLSGAEECAYPGAPEAGTQVVRSGGVWLLGMWEPHTTRKLEPNTHTVVLMFMPELLGDEFLDDLPWTALFAAPPSQRPRVTDAASRAQVLHLAAEIEEESTAHRPAWRAAVRLYLLQLLLTLRRNWQPPAESSNRPAGNLGRIMPAVQALRQAGRGRTSVLEAADVCGMSRTRFCHVFRDVMGVSFGQFCLRARLAQAAHYLTAIDIPIEAVASRVGFVDGPHLHHQFLRHYGCTPATYRRRFRTRETGLGPKQAG